MAFDLLYDLSSRRLGVKCKCKHVFDDAGHVKQDKIYDAYIDYESNEYEGLESLNTERVPNA